METSCWGGGAGDFFLLLTTSVYSLEPLGIWPYFIAPTASSGAAGFDAAGVAGVGAGFFPGHMTNVSLHHRTSCGDDNLPQ